MNFLILLCATAGVLNLNIQRAEELKDSVYSHFSAENTCLLRENYPMDLNIKATYLASEAAHPNEYSYLWPYSGTFSAMNAMYEATSDGKYLEVLDKRVLNGLEEYFDTSRKPAGYSSYISSAPLSDRFYDDNVWLGIDFTDLYMTTGKHEYLEKARTIWKFVMSGKDKVLGGGIYWCEQKKESKNTCSNAPGAVFAMKLYSATHDRRYLKQAKKLYEWTKATLQDQSDFLYFDNISLDGQVRKAKFAYNSGQMMQAAALLYKTTGQKKYLDDAQNIAKACHRKFFHEFTPGTGSSFRLINEGNVWFTAVMLRGFIELYGIDRDKTFLDDFQKSLDHAWEHARDDNGLLEKDWSGEKTESRKWLLTEAAFIEMYARMATIK